MHYPSCNDDDASAARGSEGVYTKLVPTPTALDMSSYSHATPSKHAVPLPFAVAVESSIYGQAPLTPNNTATATGAHGDAPKPAACRSKALLWLRRLPLLLLFHVYNCALGVAAFAFVVTLVPLSVGLLPLCCIGVVVFRVATLATESFAKMDVALANMVRGSDDAELRVHAHMGPARSGTFTASSSGIYSKSVLASLIFVSWRNLGAMVYFATLKFAVGILSIIVAACAVVFPVNAVVFAWDSNIQLCGFTFDDQPEAYVLSAIGVTAVGLLLLPVVASLSRQLTTLVCAEKTEYDTRQPAAVAPSMIV